MKINKFGTVTQEGERLVLHAFDFGYDPEQEKFVNDSHLACAAIEAVGQYLIDYVHGGSPALASISAIAPPVAACGDQIQKSLVSMYRYRALPCSVTPGGIAMGVITETFESDNDDTRIIIESSNGGASLRAEKISAPVAVGSVDTEELIAGLRRQYKRALDSALYEQQRAEKAEAELEDWSQSNKLDELQRALIAAEARILELTNKE